MDDLGVPLFLETPIWKYMLVKLDHLPENPGEEKKIFELPKGQLFYTLPKTNKSPRIIYGCCK